MSGPDSALLDSRVSAQARSDLARAVLDGLRRERKRLPPRLFYDATGSELFERICELDEYYVTRAEDEILAARAGAIAARFRRAPALVELGSGAATKTRRIIRALLERHGPLRYTPIDLSRTALDASARSLRLLFPALAVEPIAAEYEQGLRRLPSLGSPKLVLCLGSNLGNLDLPDAARFLARIAVAFGPDDRALVGLDLRKGRASLERAYDDVLGITAQFNRNVLARINRELGGTFDLGLFRHQAVYDERAGRVEMHLVSEIDQTVAIEDLDLEVAFRAGETIHTESSYKFTAEGIEALARAGGLRVEERWLDGGARFCVAWLSRARP